MPKNPQPSAIIIYKSSEVFEDAHSSDMDLENPHNIFGQLNRDGGYNWGGNDKTLVAVHWVENYINANDLSTNDRQRLRSLPESAYIDLEN
jgi:hypothetical protein